jgi:hypothetical protein
VRARGDIPAPCVEIVPLSEGKQPHPIRTSERVDGGVGLGHGPINQLFVTAL